MRSPKINKTKFGFYQYQPLPSEEELAEYYSQKYYQEGKGSYDIKYSSEEVEYFRLKSSIIYTKLRRMNRIRKEDLVLDVGCGEGWLLNYFAQKECVVSGIDFSRFGLEKYHPHLLESFEQGNIYSLLKKKFKREEKYDVIVLANVIEHVRDPEKLIAGIRRILSPRGTLIIVAPNDFSRLHEHLLGKKIISHPFWLCYPDHISYFNNESMTFFLEAKGFQIKAILADSPVDLNLLNNNSNYINNPEKGKNVHLFRVAVDNLLASINPEKLLDLYEILGEMGIGRNLSYFCSME